MKEYFCVKLPPNTGTADLAGKINAIAADGWELVGVPPIGHSHVFSRDLELARDPVTDVDHDEPASRFDRLTKANLLAELEAAGVEGIPASATKAELIERLETL